MPRKLLVIDDRSETAQAISLEAQRAGFEVRVVQDPRAAVTAFVSFLPDVVMLELIMPGMDGIEVLRGLLTSGIPAHIVLTASSGIGDAYVRLADGVARFHGVEAPEVLRRPFQQADLLRLLRGRLPPDDGA